MQRITYKERKVLEKLIKNIGIKWRALGRAMNRKHNVIMYEVRHHSSPCLDYNADVAQGIYERKQAKKGNTKKLLKNSTLLKYIIKRLKEGWSPELISGRLQNEELKSEYGYVSHETIYAYIYSQEKEEPLKI